jgi:hypothetical protein
MRALENAKATSDQIPESTERHGALDLIANMQEVGPVPHAVASRELYCSSNGDRWYLCRDADRVFVVHVPNVSSGGQVEKLEIGEFLARDGGGPEHQELLRLIGALVDAA